ncbi:MAG TPA: NnrS family protein [Fibrobacteria bacterium]|nr:NnrS family protein [Fibrobacteria bacterium]
MHDAGNHNWKLKAACAEPYRVLFPLGLIGAAAGLGVWIPHYFWPHVFGYPGQSHAVLQIQGFLLCFVFGFLGTMLPKVHGVAPLGPVQFLLFPAGLIALMVAALGNFSLTAQLIHLGLLANFVIFMLRRWPERRGNPPSFFVFIAIALLADLTGTILRIVSLTGLGSAQTFRLGGLLQFQAFPLMLVLGVGGFLLPKLLVNETIDPKRFRPAGTGTLGLLAAALLFLGGYVVEACLPVYPLSVQLGSGLRATVWFWFLLTQLRLQRVPGGLPAYLAAARWSLWFMGLGMLMPVFLPRYILAWEHLVFITGILWLTLSVASRVVAAHGGKLGALESSRKSVLAFGGFTVLAAATRVSTEIWTAERNLHLALASAFALCGLAFWARRFVGLLFRFPGDGT